MEKKKVYESPQVEVTGVIMERSIAQLCRISAQVYLEPDWEAGGMLGENTATEGGDIYLFDD
jgi:hypothetical protein